MEQPRRFVAQEKNMVCKLNKVIYDLKSLVVLSLKLVFRSAILVNLSSFIGVMTLLFLLFYVDDILPTDSNVNDIENAKEYLKAPCVIKDIGRPGTFLALKLLTSNMKWFFSNESILRSLCAFLAASQCVLL